MKKRTKRVYDILKPKSKALGFTKEELESVAADIADNLDLEDDASDEDIDAKATEVVDAAIPYLKLAQKASNRVIQKFKDDNEPNGDADDDKPVDDDPNNSDKPKKERIPDWAQALLTQNKAMQDEILAMKSEKKSEGRRSKLKALLKDTGTYGKSVIKNFDKMKFENDADFDDFYDGVVEDLGALNQERANAGLAKLGASAASGTKKEEDDKPEVLNEKQMNELAESM